LKDSTIIPAEVKSGQKGQLKSLQLFLQTHSHAPYGLKISEVPYQKNDTLVSIPFYMIEAWLRENKP
jgi:hypothetical protein